MGKINVGRLILGGVVAGIVMDILAYLVDGVWLAWFWNTDMKNLGHSAFTSGQMVWFNVIGIVMGLAAIWLYAAIRPRFNPGMKTAIYAGVAAWIIGYVLPNSAFMCVTGLFSRHLALYTTLGALVETVAGTIAGAALYKEA